MRKMRCDDQQNGCAPCMQNHSECKTTDRITGRATVRGYVSGLEHRLEELENHNRELQSRLISLGEEVKLGDGYADPTTAHLLQWHKEQRLGSRERRDDSGQAASIHQIKVQMHSTDPGRTGLLAQRRRTSKPHASPNSVLDSPATTTSAFRQATRS